MNKNKNTNMTNSTFKLHLTLLPLIILAIMATGCGDTKLVFLAPAEQLAPELVKNATYANDIPQIEQWTVKSLGLPDAWKKWPTTKAVKVAVVGTGIDYNHPDLRDALFIEEHDGKPSVGIDLLENGRLAFDLFGSDTAAAGIIAAAHDGKGINGIIPKASLIPIRYIDNDGMSTLGALIIALDQLVLIRPHVVYLNFREIILDEENPELKAAQLKAFKDRLAKLREARVPLVVASGNSNKQIGTATNELWKIMASFDNVLVVAGVNEKNLKSALSNFGPQVVHTTAPAEKIWAPVVGGQYKQISSTQLAAAHVAGAIGLAASQFDGKLSYRDYFKALASDEGSTPVGELKDVALAANTLNIKNFMDVLETY